VGIRLEFKIIIIPNGCVFHRTVPHDPARTGFSSTPRAGLFGNARLHFIEGVAVSRISNFPTFISVTGLGGR
jgi:hypothetical protein